MSPFEAKGDSCFPLGIDVAPYRPGLFSVTLGHAQVPARGKRVRSRLREELVDDLGGRSLEGRGPRVERRPRLTIKPQHEALAILAGIMGGALGDLPLMPAGGKLFGGHLTDHLAQPSGGLHAYGRGRLRHLLMQYRRDGACQIAHGAVRVVAVEGAGLPVAQAPSHDVTQHRGPRLVEVSGEVVHLGFP